MPTANSQQPTANSQQPTANSQQPTANSQQPTANSQQPTANSQQPTANSQQPTLGIHCDTLYRSDCKTALDELIQQGKTVDLIYLDPPFNSSRIYSMIFNSGGVNAQQTAFHDMWNFQERTNQLFLGFENDLENFELPSAFKEFMKAWISILKNGNEEDRKLLNYLMYMTERLIRMKKVLKPTGSIYLHCDPTASHYIKIIMDGIFGRNNFVNEIIWSYTGNSRPKKSFPGKHDVILFYCKKKHKNFFNPIIIPYSERTLKRYNHEDEKGRYKISALRHGKQDKVYMSEGKFCEDVFSDIPVVRKKQERLGYPTQKPVALLNRIIKASCPKGGIVLDPFCGCGTAMEAAHHNNMHWIGIDISGLAIEEIKKRLEKNGISKYDYQVIEGNPETMAEYNRMNAYEKQDWLIRRIHGFPNQRKSGDQGIDGELTVHAGFDGNRDTFQKVIFSVKTGNQAKPEHVRELMGTVEQHEAAMGVLILDKEPSIKMEATASNYGKIKYIFEKTSLPQEYDKIQIITAEEIIDGKNPNTPPTMQTIKFLRDQQRQGQSLF